MPIKEEGGERRSRLKTVIFETDPENAWDEQLEEKEESVWRKTSYG